MRAPSPAILGALALHAAVAALLLAPWPEREVRERPSISSVPVSIISETTIEAASVDNPSEELVTEDAATAPPEPQPAPPEPIPTPPLPTPRPAEKTPPPRPAPTPRPTPPQPRPQPPRPAPPRPTPPRPAPPREEATLDLDALAGPRRPVPTPGPRAATGQRGQGDASRAQGQTIDWAGQVYPNWVLNCDVPGADQLRIQMVVTISSSGQITGGPTLSAPRSDPVWRATADSAIRAIRASAPFEVPEGFEGGTQRLNFRVDQACRNR